MNFLLRPPVAADYPALASWIPNATECLRWAGPKIPFPFLPADLPRLLEVENGRNCSLVAANGDSALLGFGQYWPRNETTAHLGRIIVSPAERSRGLGKTLIQLLLADAQTKAHAEIVTLRVYRDNLAAVSLYTKLGFTIASADSTSEVLAMIFKLNP